MQVESLVAPTEEDVGDEEEIEIKDEGEMEVENLKHAVDPGQPTSKQIEEHRKTHFPQGPCTSHGGTPRAAREVMTSRVRGGPWAVRERQYVSVT